MVDLNKYLIQQDRKMQRAISGKPAKKKRAKLTPSQRLYVWEHPKLYGRKCSICGHSIIKQSDMELDHTKPYSKGGTKMNLAHKECNRMKGSKGLRHIQKKMGFKPTTKRKTRSDKGKKKSGINDSLKIKVPKFDFKF